MNDSSFTGILVRNLPLVRWNQEQVSMILTKEHHIKTVAS